MEVNIVSQNVPLDGLDERLPATFQSLEKVGTAEAHQPLPRTGKVLQLSILVGCGLFRWCVVNVICKPISRQFQIANGIHNMR